MPPQHIEHDSSRRSTLRPLVALLAPTLLLAACGGGGSGGPGAVASGARMSGNVVAVAPTSTTLEAEPNDTVEQAHVLGQLDPGGSRTILGSITDSGSDPFDGFQLTAPEPIRVDLTLSGQTAGADLDVYVADPVSLQFVERFETNSASETGSFIAHGTFFVVVRAFSGTSQYTLQLDAAPAGTALVEAEPNDTNADAQYVGALSNGERITIDGALGATDAADRFLVALPDGGPFSIALAHPGTADFDVRVNDATADLTNPTQIATFQASSSPEIGEVTLGAMTLAQVEVFPFSGTGNWQLTLFAGPSSGLRLAAPPAVGTDAAPSAKSTLPSALFTGAVPTAQRGSADAEARRIRSGGRGGAFAAPVTPLWDGALIVTPRTETTARAAVRAVVERRGGRVEAEIPGGPQLARFAVPGGLDEEQRARYTVALAASLAEHAARVEPDWRHFVTALPDTRPNDTHYNLQWHYEQIQLPAAWDLERGDAAVTIAVLDTGSTPHPDLVAREVQGIDMISNPQISGDGDGIDNDPFDVGDSNGSQPSSFHGSHVAGTIGASTNDGRGVAGVTWAGRIMHVRVLGIGGGSTFDIINGVLWAAGLPNASGQVPTQAADVINMSLGGPGVSQSFQDACTSARNAGSVVIAAAGNENSSQPSFPAAYNDVVSVAAVDFESNRAPYSNFHPTVDIAAPGGDVTRDRNGDGYADGVLSTKPDDTVNPTNYENYSFYQGTSMAAPHVAGVAALILSVNPTLTPGQVEGFLASTATDIGAPGRDDQYGEGLVNAFAAVQAAGGGGGGAPALSLATSNLLFESAVDTRRVSVANVGGGLLEVQSVSASTTSGGNWLSGVRVVPAAAGSTDTTAIDVSVSAAGLANGVYGGSVAVQSNGGTSVIEVTLALGTSTAPTNYTIYVLAVDAATFDTVAERVVQSTGSTSYSFTGLPAGDYYLVAGTDEDGDFQICDPGEPLCGVYPTLETPVILSVTEEDVLAGLDIVVQQANLPASTTSGFRRLPQSLSHAPSYSTGVTQ